MSDNRIARRRALREQAKCMNVFWSTKLERDLMQACVENITISRRAPYFDFNDPTPGAKLS